jgi:glycosyl transferase family 1
VLSAPSPSQRDVMDRIIELSAKLVVMAAKGEQLLRSVYGVSPEKIAVIPHGIPDFPFLGTREAKGRFGFSDKKVILTFGLLSPNKGIEVMIDAMPSILARCPNAVYIVLGATHPNLVLREGEAYRTKLMTRARELGVDSHVVFFDQFVDRTTLLDFIAMCDVYATPYLNESQMTSGTLAYSFGAGKAVVSTPYLHARELLADGRGVLVPFGDSKATGKEISELLTNDVRRESLRKDAYAFSRDMTWEQISLRYLALFDEVRGAVATHSVRVAVGLEAFAVPGMQLGHFLSMCDGTGILQHAVYSVPDRSHGYCVDDNARALILACALGGPDETSLPEELTARFAAFVQHAWNPDTRRFRNFMSYARQWLEDQGSEDSHGRTLWALCECARSDTNVSRRRWARSLFESALATVETFRSPRAWAFSLLGLDAYCASGSHDPSVDRVRSLLAEKLMVALTAATTANWTWYEDGLAYDNARLPQALIETGIATATPLYIDAGVKSLRWLMTLQTAPSGCFRPVGTEGFGRLRQLPLDFDQQPVEAAATISACLAAWRATGNDVWKSDAMRAFRWFLGDNDLGIALADPVTGACSDGLHRDRRNENNGAESVLSYLLGLAEIRSLARGAAEVHGAAPSPPLALSA